MKSHATNGIMSRGIMAGRHFCSLKLCTSSYVRIVILQKKVNVGPSDVTASRHAYNNWLNAQDIFSEIFFGVLCITLLSKRIQRVNTMTMFLSQQHIQSSTTTSNIDGIPTQKCQTFKGMHSKYALPLRIQKKFDTKIVVSCSV